MATRGPWSVKGIDTKAREAALQAARSEGVTLGDYLNRLLLISEQEGNTMSNKPHQRPSNDVSETAPSQALDALTSRIEAVEARSTLAITGMDQSVVGLLAKLENSINAQEAMEGRFELTSDELKQTQHILEKRLERVESDDTSIQSLRALKSLESALGRLATDLEDQKDTSAATQTRIGDIAHRVDRVSGDVDDKINRLNERLETTLESAAESVKKAVDQAELRAEGASRHLSDRMTQIEAELFDDKRVHHERMGAIENKVTSTLSDVTQTIDRLGERMETTEATARNANDISDRLNEAELQTNEALRALQSNVNRLDQRLEDLGAEENESIADVRQYLDVKLQAVAEELSKSVDAIRSELAEQIEAASNVPADAFIEINNAVSEIHKRAKSAERRQNQAIESMGEEVAKLTKVLDKRVQQIEQRNDSDLTSTVRDQIDEMSNSLLKRMQDLEARDPSDDKTLNAVADQMGQLAETLNKRVEDSEERSAHAIREFTEHMSTISRTLESKQEKGLSQISAQIKDSEKRQAGHLNEALTNVQSRISQVEHATASAVSPIQKAMSSLADRLSAVEDFANPPGVARKSEPDINFQSFGDALAEQTPAAAVNTPSPVDDDLWAADTHDDSFPDFSAADDDTSSYVEPTTTSASSASSDDPWGDQTEDFFGETPAATPARTETNDYSHESDEYDFDTPASDFKEHLDDASSFTQAPAGGNDYLSRARAAANAGAEQKPSRQSPKQNYKASSSKLPIIAAGAVLALSAAGTAAYMNMRGKQEAPREFLSEPTGFVIEEPSLPASTDGLAGPLAGEDGSDVTDTPENNPTADTASSTPEEAAEKPTVAEERPAAPAPARAAPKPETRAEPIQTRPASTPKPAQTAPPVQRTAPPQAAVPAPAQPQVPASITQYQRGMTALNNGQIAEGAALIRQSAEAGQPMAQYRYSKLFERGQGVPRDLVQSREWTERAADAGNVKAMHDLAVFFAEGEGGQQSYAGAARWFREAADFGLVDSQFNLGVLYEEGLGVTANPAEALYWYRVAAKMGDSGATPKINELTQQVSPEDAARTAQLAASYTPKPSNPTANGRFPEATASTQRASQSTNSADRAQIVEAQMLLNKLGFNVGVADGQLGLQTRDAILSFQAANSLPQSGSVTPTLVRQLRIAVG